MLHLLATSNQKEIKGTQCNSPVEDLDTKNKIIHFRNRAYSHDLLHYTQ